LVGRNINDQENCLALPDLLIFTGNKTYPGALYSRGNQMNKFAKYFEAKSSLEQLSKQVEALENDESLQSLLQFKDKLEKLMADFDMSQEDVISLWGVGEIKPKSHDKRRNKRPLKTYLNPHTEEIVKTRGGNHRTLNAWREQYGKEEVDSWLK
jgi:hypothetical protein